MNNLTELSDKQKKTKKIVQIGVFALAGLVFAPIALLTLKGIFGLIAVGLIGLMAIEFAPWAAMKIANEKVKAIQSEAAQNPIPTMENEYIQKTQNLKAHKAALEAYMGAIGNFKSKAQSFARQFPNNKVKISEHEDIIRKMEALKIHRQHCLRQTEEDLRAFRQTIDEASAIWDMAMEAQKVNKLAGVEIDPMSEIKTKTAIDSVSKAMNQSFAQLELAMLEAPGHDGLILDITPTTVKEIAR